MLSARVNTSALLCHSLLPHTNMQLIIILISILLFVFYAALIGYYRAVWRSIPNFPQPQTSNLKPQTSNLKPQTFISIIIPARNEENNLPALLKCLSGQSYDKDLFEVIVVDDHSTDNTAEIVKRFSAGNIKLISLKDHIDQTSINSYKKKAIEVAIAQSKGELIVSTDADCIVPHNWLESIASFYKETGATFIVMPVSFSYRNNFLEIFQALDFMVLQGITGAAVFKNAHSMCNGANLAYSRKAFDAVDGFKNINTIASGDDMLLMHKIYKQYPHGIKYLRSKEVIVQTEPMHSWKDFFNQRIRWASKADKYDDKRIFGVLTLVYFFNVWLLVLPVIAAFKNIQYSLFTIHYSLFTSWLALLAGKTTIELFFLYPVATFFQKEKLLWLFPVAQPFHILYTIIAGWLGKFGSYQWKGRKVK